MTKHVCPSELQATLCACVHPAAMLLPVPHLGSGLGCTFRLVQLPMAALSDMFVYCPKTLMSISKPQPSHVVSQSLLVMIRLCHCSWRFVCSGIVGQYPVPTELGRSSGSDCHCCCCMSQSSHDCLSWRRGYVCQIHDRAGRQLPPPL